MSYWIMNEYCFDNTHKLLWCRDVVVGRDGIADELMGLLTDNYSNWFKINRKPVWTGKDYQDSSDEEGLAQSSITSFEARYTKPSQDREDRYPRAIEEHGSIL